MEDTKIIDLYWQRTESAITATAQKYGAYCHSIAWRILRDEGDSDECVNDTWLAAWNTMPPSRPAVLATFLGRITRNLAIDRARQRGAEKRGAGELPLALEELKECVSPSDNVDAALEELALTEVLDRFLASLPQKQRVIFLRRYWYLCPIKEIAAACRLTPEDVKVTLFRTRRKLRQILEKEGFAP